jgi:hypothetical protein
MSQRRKLNKRNRRNNPQARPQVAHIAADPSACNADVVVGFSPSELDVAVAVTKSPGVSNVYAIKDSEVAVEALRNNQAILEEQSQVSAEQDLSNLYKQMAIIFENISKLSRKGVNPGN